MTIDVNYSQDTITSTDYNIELVSALIAAYNEANGAFNRANTIGGIYNIALVAGNGMTVNTGIVLTLASNGTFVIAANNASTAAVGVVQLTDSQVSTSTTTAATPNSVKLTNDAAAAAFLEANSFQSIINSAFTLANTDATNLTINSGVNVSQNANISAAFAEANSFQSVINSAFTTANSGQNLALSAFAATNAYAVTANVIFVNVITDYMTGTLTVNSLTSNVGINTGFITANSNISSSNFNTTGVVNTQITSVSSITTGTNYNLTLRDSGQIITYSNTVNLNVNIGSTIALPAGFRTIFVQANTGNVTFLANGVNLFSRIGVSMKTLGPYGSATLFCYSSNNFILSGEIV